MNLWRSMSLAPRDMARRRRRALRKRQDDQIQNEDESSSSTPPEATGTATGNDDQPEDNKKEGEQTSEGEPSPTDDVNKPEESPKDDSLEQDNPDSSSPPAPSPSPSPEPPKEEPEPTPTSIVEPDITETPAILQTPGPNTHDTGELTSYDAEGFKSNAEQYNQWAASIDSSIGMVREFLETQQPEEKDEPTTSSSEEQPPTSTEEEYASTKTIRPTQEAASESKDEGFKLPFSTGVAVAIGIGAVAVIVLIILMIWRPCCRRNLNGKDRRLKPPKTIKEMLYENDVPVAAARSPDRNPLRASDPFNTPAAAAPMMQQSAALTQPSSGAAGIGARSRFANAFRKITGSSAPGGGMEESTYGEVVDMPSISSSKSSLQDASSVRPLPNTVQPGWARGHQLNNSTGSNNRSSGVPVSAVPTGGKLSDPYSATG